MKIVIKTLVDITETGARRGEDPVRSKQQDNYNTTIQTAGFRANLIPGKCQVLSEDIKDQGFGSRFKGKHNLWQLSLSLEYESAITLEMLQNDFDLVPFLSGLTETADFSKDVFRTKGAETNIVFELLND